MDNVGKPLIGVLVATVLVFALWVIALKPSSSSSGKGANSNPGLGQFQGDINAAHQAVNISAADNARAGGGSDGTPTTPGVSTKAAPATTHSTTTKTVTKTTTTTVAKSSTARHPASRPATSTAAGSVSTPAGRLATVARAMRTHKVVAVLFYNPAAADDQAVKQELAAVPTAHGHVVKLTIPLTELASYTAITEQVPVNISPTLVVIAPNGQAEEIAGFTDRVEIQQRVADALALK